MQCPLKFHRSKREDKIETMVSFMNEHTQCSTEN